jgi:hypothetical protein
MSKLFDFSSLAMIPTAVKDGKLYSIRPTDGDGDFTFSRGSNLAATRVDVNGLIEKGRENTILYSNDFSRSQWNKDNTTAVSGYTSYDGSNNAWKIIPSTSTTYHRIKQIQTWSYDVRTASIYAKADGYNFVNFVTYTGATDLSVQVDLSNGTIVSQLGSTLIDTDIRSAGNGWYRISITGSGSSTTSQYGFQVYLLEDLGVSSWAGDGTSGILFADAQRELGLVATDYIETGSSTAQAGILEDLPRLDYSGSCPALLLEPQRSNSITGSEYFDGGNLQDTQLSAEYNTADTLSPEGTYNAVKLTATNNFPRYYDYPTIGDNVDVTLSVFAKAGDASVFTMRAFDKSSDTAVVNFDLSAGTAELSQFDDLSPSFTIEDMGNDWYRCSITTNTGSGATAFQIRPISHAQSETGGWSGSNYIYTYGAQMEAGSYPTSYIPTYGSAVTRSLDKCELFGMNASGISTSNNWTYFIDIDNFEAGQEAFYLRSTSGELMHLYTTSLGYRTSASGSTYPASWSFTGYNGTNTQLRMCIRYDGDKLVVFMNGSKKSDEIDSSLLSSRFNNPFDQDKFHFAGNSKWDTNQKLFFDTALTDSECIALTTI